MCGIIGIVSLLPVEDRTTFIMQLDTMRHRGPDDSGEWWSSDWRVGFGHRRLAIIDLSILGHQPMHDNSRELVIVFNGEIYNFRDLRRELNAKGHCFSTSSDTEVILEAYNEWGTDCLDHLNGTFAFALFDSRKQKLFMARDRAGEKPLFYSYDNGVLRFASELKALMADPTFHRNIDFEALDCFLAQGYVPGERCILQGINKLPPSHAFWFDLNTGQTRLWRYWRLPSFTNEGKKKPSEAELLDKLESLLENSVRRQLLADVPVGILLSGGVDSSLITAMAVRSSPHVKTFTIRFPGYGKYDETKHARLIAKHFGTEHIELDAVETTADLLTILARQFDEPIVDSSMIPAFLVSQLIRPHCTVALGGDGGDELFGGYTTHNRMVFLQNWFGFIAPFVRESIAKFSEHNLPNGFKGRVFLQSLGVDFEQGLPQVSTLFDPISRINLMTYDKKWNLASEQIVKQRIPVTTDVLQRITRMDFENYLPEDILVKMDRSSMLNSIEVRAPFLDFHLIEFAFGTVPSHLKATAFNRKVLLRKLCDRLFPPEFNNRRKQGFSIPLAQWLMIGPWRDLFYEILLDAENGVFNKKFIHELIKRQERRHADSERLFALVLFELWRMEYDIKF
jgi:asparagine synthase (glutamine-hydrolysing)